MNGSADAGKDYFPVTGTILIFEPGDTEKSLIIKIINDDIFEEAEQFNITLSIVLPRPGLTIGRLSVMQITIMDNDAPAPGKYRSERNIPCLSQALAVIGPSTCKQNNYENNRNNFPRCERVRDARRKVSTYSCSKDVLAKTLNNLDKPHVRCQPRQGNKPVRLACLDVPHVGPTLAMGELQSIDRETRKLTSENDRNPLRCTAALILPRDKGGRGLRSVEQEYKFQ